MKTTQSERDEVLAYFVHQSDGDPVVHLEKVATERVGPNIFDIWDVHCTESRWWAVSPVLNMYSQVDFKSRDVVLTFHIGMMARVISHNEIPLTESGASLLPKTWRLWEQAVEGMTTSREAEDFQSVGVRLRECIVTFASEIADPDLVSASAEPPKNSDVVAWSELFVAHLASSSSSEQLRSYCKKLTRETWDLVNQLTHAKNAGSYDAEIGIAAVAHFVSTMTAVRMRWSVGPNQRCAACGSYQVGGGTCVRCDWINPDYIVPDIQDDIDLAARLGSPCTPSSDISTFMSPDDYT